ncbi:hypothetical protein ACHHYP_17094 [Achlya hypogyna]|uniref:Uncharacterized protein n=1 Tax=Achlya hypogyna TaxID=1202772 RepID=A0A1V9Y5A0_ACHHY|nr:hypothetical protein ACHHYP_17094 [Achlya hypogyna]
MPFLPTWCSFKAKTSPAKAIHADAVVLTLPSPTSDMSKARSDSISSESTTYDSEPPSKPLTNNIYLREPPSPIQLSAMSAFEVHAAPEQYPPSSPIALPAGSRTASWQLPMSPIQKGV